MNKIFIHIETFSFPKLAVLVESLNLKLQLEQVRKGRVGSALPGPSKMQNTRHSNPAQSHLPILAGSSQSAASSAWKSTTEDRSPAVGMLLGKQGTSDFERRDEGSSCGWRKGVVS
jgi:hypothetical protein